MAGAWISGGFRWSDLPGYILGKRQRDLPLSAIVALSEAVEEAKRDMREEMAEEVTKEVREQDMKIIVEMLQEYNATKENAVIKLQAKFPQNAGLAAEIVEKYWQEN